MKRRDFIKDIAAGSLFLSFKPSLFAQQNFPDLALIQGDSPAVLTRKAVASLGGIGGFISKGDVVLVKPNIGWDRTPQQAACTNPQVVKTLVELSFEGGAKEVKVIDNPCNQAKRTYLRSGIAEAAKQAGAKVLFPNRHRLKRIPLQGEWLKEWQVYTDYPRSARPLPGSSIPSGSASGHWAVGRPNSCWCAARLGTAPIP